VNLRERLAPPLKARERHQLRKRSFDAGARLYDKFRPGYPEPLFDDLVRLSGIPAGGRILEIGPGTGQATLPLARRGFSILGLEIGANMARLCRKNLRVLPHCPTGAAEANVEILNTAFEDWPAKNGDCTAPSPTQALRGTVPRFSHEVRKFSANNFDMVLAATAFHWIPARLAFTRCARVLKPHDSLALVWNFLDTPDNPFYNDLRTLYHRLAPQIHVSKPPEQRIERQLKKIVSSGLFGPVTVLRHPWQREYDADSYIGLLKTMSDHAILAPKVRRSVFRAIRKLINAHGGSFIRPAIAVLFLAPKRET